MDRGVSITPILTSFVIETVPFTLTRSDSSLDQRVGEWVRSMAADWYHTLPDEPTIVAPLLTDVVPALSGSAISELKAP
jgi:hypothetical protein